MSDPENAFDVSAEELLRAWFHWWHKNPQLPPALPGDLHIKTAALLAARAVQDGRKIYTPDYL